MIAKTRTFLLFSAFVLGQVATACVVSESSSDDDEPGTGGSSGSDSGGSGGGGTDEDAGAGGSSGSASGGSGGGGGTSPDDGGAGGSMDGGTPDGGPVVELIDCPSRDTAGSTEVSGGINTDTTWSGVVHVTSDVRVGGGATLTIEPGTVVLADVDTVIDVGWAGGAATLDAQGTADMPIAFCGVTEDAGFWEGLIVSDTVTSNSVLENALIADAGGNSAPAALILERAITVDAVQVRNSASDGVHAADFSAMSAGLTVEGAAGTAVVLTGSGGATRFPLGGALVDNGENVVEIDFAGITVDTTFHALPVPYVQGVDVRVSGGAELNVEAGVDYRFAVDTEMVVGWAGGEATLHVNGTAARPVTFRGTTAEAGHWDFIRIEDTVTSDSTISHARILHGGRTGPVLTFAAAVTVDNLTLDTNAEGAVISAAGLDPDSTTLTITRTEAGPLTVQPNALTTIPEGGDFTGNTTDRITVEAGGYDVSGTVPNLGVPYYLAGTLRVTGGALLDIAPGTEIIANSDIEIDVGWAGGAATFTAAGTASEPIVFRGADDVNGYWRGIVIGDTALSSSSLDYVEIHNAGLSGSGGLRLENEISVTNTTITKSAGYGLYVDDAFTTNYATTNTFEDNTQGSIGTY